MPTVIPFHRAVVSDPAFAPADDSAFAIHTRWIETEFDNTIAAYSGSTPTLPRPRERHRITVEVGGKRLEVVLPGGLSLGGGGAAALAPRRRRHRDVRGFEQGRRRGVRRLGHRADAGHHRQGSRRGRASRSAAATSSSSSRR